jgi:alginate O-acetyltransferase complex protein AlgI
LRRLLFNDPVFLFVYLPIVLAGYYAATRYRRPRLAIWWMLLASIVFYVYDDVARLLPLITGSVVFNYVVGALLRRRRSAPILAIGIAANLILLGYFKYAQFLVETVAAIAGLGAPTLAIVLPIGISFYTFTQIAFLVDVYRGHATGYRPVDYALFVTFFPHLVAGPILRHNETVPQFERAARQPVDSARIAAGWAWFSLGLAKKALLADGIAPYADAVFSAADRGEIIASSDAWIGTLAYSLQLYFDFSGYSDMAIGLAMISGIAFPLNFNSPYKATSLIDFWRRWHMTLSSLLRDYLYIPLGGNRRGEIRRHVNLMITMVLGGLWHGASWNFVVWGALHGAGLVVNNTCRTMLGGRGITVPARAGHIATLGFVVLAWVPFRSETMASAVRVWEGLFAFRFDGSVPGLPERLNGVPLTGGHGVAYAWLAFVGLIALAAPNTQEILGGDRGWPAWWRIQWQPTPRWAVALGVLFGLAIARTLSQPTSFLYFRF